MTQNILVMGGTSFFGKRLVTTLLDASCNVTVATRGRAVDPFGDRVERLMFDRQSLESMKEAFGDMKFDIVFDQIGYSQDDAADAVEVFSGKVGHYVYTSSGSVYAGGSDIVEADFDPITYKITPGRYPAISYEDGKRGAEAVFFQRAPFSVAAARFPIVIGQDDVIQRFQFHVKRIMERLPIIVPHPRGKMAYALAEDAGRFLAWLGLEHKTGPYNAASHYALDAAEFTQRVGDALGVEPIILEDGPKDAKSPYAISDDFVMNSLKAKSEGFVFTPFDEWLPKTAVETAKLLGLWESAEL